VNALHLGKRINRVSVSLDDETFALVSHLANFDGRAPSEYLARLVEDYVHGHKLRLQAACEDGDEDHCVSRQR
jgi:predicted transcriptional regulator